MNAIILYDIVDYVYNNYRNEKIHSFSYDKDLQTVRVLIKDKIITYYVKLDEFITTENTYA